MCNTKSINVLQIKSGQSECLQAVIRLEALHEGCVVWFVGLPVDWPLLSERQLNADPGYFRIDAGVEDQVLDIDIDGVQDIK